MDHDFGKESSNQEIGGVICFILCIVAALIYVAARHSTFVQYNEGRLMIKLLGRYVAYATPLAVIVWACVSDGDVADGAVKKGRRITAALCGAAAVWIPYVILYQRVFWNPAEDWLSGCRGLENIGYLEGGLWVCAAVCLGAIVAVLTGERIAVWALCLTMGIHVAAAMGSWEKNNYSVNYARLMENFLEDHRDEEMTILCNDSLNYVSCIQLWTFYMVDDEYMDILIQPVGYDNYTMNLYEDRTTYFMLNSDAAMPEIWERAGVSYEGNKEDLAVFLKWDPSLFEETELQVDLEWKDEDTVEVSYEGDRNTILVGGGLVWATEVTGGRVKATLELKNLWNPEGMELAVYNLCEMRKTSLRLLEK